MLWPNAHLFVNTNITIPHSNRRTCSSHWHAVWKGGRMGACKCRRLCVHECTTSMWCCAFAPAYRMLARIRPTRKSPFRYKGQHPSLAPCKMAVLCRSHWLNFHLAMEQWVTIRWAPSRDDFPLVLHDLTSRVQNFLEVFEVSELHACNATHNRLCM